MADGIRAYRHQTIRVWHGDDDGGYLRHTGPTLDGIRTCCHQTICVRHGKESLFKFQGFYIPTLHGKSVTFGTSHDAKRLELPHINRGTFGKMGEGQSTLSCRTTACSVHKPINHLTCLGALLLSESGFCRASLLFLSSSDLPTQGLTCLGALLLSESAANSLFFCRYPLDFFSIASTSRRARIWPKDAIQADP